MEDSSERTKTSYKMETQTQCRIWPKFAHNLQ